MSGPIGRNAWKEEIRELSPEALKDKVCPNCNKTCPVGDLTRSQYTQWRQHFMEYPNLCKKKVFCPECEEPMSFANKSNLNRHMRLKHSSGTQAEHRDSGGEGKSSDDEENEEDEEGAEDKDKELEQQVSTHNYPAGSGHHEADDDEDMFDF